MMDMRENSRSLNRRGETCLVVVDVQERLMPHIMNNERVIANIVKMIRVARRLSMPVVHCEQEKLGPTVEPVAETLDGLDPYLKSVFSCFGGVGFGEELERHGSRNLLVVGVETHVCVMQTVLQGLSAGYNVHVPGDAVSSQRQSDRDAGFARMRDAGAVMSTVEMAIFELLVRAGTDEFRSLLPLLKS